jgi:hypothetical protein
MRFALHLSALLAAALALPAAGQSVLDSLFGPKTSWPPDRTAWYALPAEARAAHARAVHLALESWAAPQSWSAAGVSGAVRVGPTAEVTEGVVCRAFDDSLTAGGKTLKVRDAACWGDGWEYALEGGRFEPVLAPAFAEPGRVYEVKKAETLARIAKRAKVDAAALAALNPALPEKVPVGTLLLLP